MASKTKAKVWLKEDARAKAEVAHDRFLNAPCLVSTCPDRCEKYIASAKYAALSHAYDLNVIFLPPFL